MAEFQPVRFGKYQLIEKVATGGMAEVYKAKSYGVAGFEKLVCIKKILPHLSKNPEFVKMFINEAKIAVSLNHANIVQVYDLGKVSDEYFMGMEFIHGQDLMTIIKVGRKTRRFLPIPTGVYIITELARGLEYAHNLSDPSGRPLHIVHQDVSPHNLMISYEGDVKLMDFGIARIDTGEGEQEKVGGGKFAYMAPEQANGTGVDHRSDIFAAGIILYELITGQRLYAGKDRREKMRMVRTADIPPPRAVNPEIPNRLEEILLRALARDPDDRYQHARDLQEDLLSFLYDVGMRVSRADLAQFQKEMFAEEYRRANAGAVVNAIFKDLSELEHQPGGGDEPDLVVEDAEEDDGGAQWGFLEGSGSAEEAEEGIGASLVEGERRQVEALAVEITGLTDIADRVGEEELLRLNFSFLKSVANLVKKYQGEIQTVDADRLLVFWGLHKSTSKDLELALRCASDLRRLSEKFAEAKGEQVRLSLGVHRGAVLVGPPPKRGAKRQYTPWGDTVKHARRLCDQAGLDEVLVSQKVYSLIAEHAECELLDPVRVKWAAGSITPYRLLRLRGRGERSSSGRWVKRSNEFEVLKRAIGAAASGEAAVLSLEGEAGSGKARFLREIREIVRERDITFYVGRGYYYRTEVPFLPFREILEQICGFEEPDDDPARKEKLNRLTELRLDPIDIHVIGKLFGLEFDGSNLKYLSGDQIRLSTFEAIGKVFAGLTAERFIILALENFEHLDTYSRDLAVHLIRTLPERRLLLVLTQPTAADLDFPEESRVERLEMPPMGREEVAAFCSELLGVAELPDALLDRVVQASGGNALFAKEILAQLRRQGILRISEGQVSLEGNLAEAEIPATVEDLLAARIGSLASTERVVLEVAATIGRAFERAVLGEVTRLDAEPLGEVLARLQALKLVRPARDDEQAAHADHVFRNNLCWEATLRGILSGRSKEYHVRVGEALESLHEHDLRPLYERLSRHYQAGGMLARASRFAERAGLAHEQAYYSREAQRCYQRAILLLRGADSEGDGVEVSAHLAELYLRLGAIEARHGQNDEAVRSFGKALDFAGEAEDDRLTAKAMIELARLLAAKGDAERTGRYLRQAQELAQEIGDDGLLADADEEMAKWALQEGDFAEAKVALNRALAAARGGGDRVRIARILGSLGSYYSKAGQYGLAERHLGQARDLAMETDDKTLQGEMLNNLGVNFIAMERFPEALDCYRKACEIRRSIEHRRGVIVNLHGIGDAYFRMGEYARSYQYFAESLEAAKANGWERGEAMNLVYLGYLQALQGEVEEGEEQLEQGIRRCLAAADPETAAQGKVFLARVLTRRGDMERARAVLSEASDLGGAGLNLGGA